MEAQEVKQARAKVQQRERERAIWTEVERAGREARAAEAVKAAETAKPREVAGQRRGEVSRP